MKKLLFTLLKILISAAIIGWLFVNAVKTQDGVNVFRTMLDAPKQWDLLAAAVVSTAAAIVLTLIRWCFLVRSWGSPFPFGMPCASASSVTCSTCRRRASPAATC